MGTRFFGCLTLIAGLVIVWASFRTDQLGIGRHKGVGEGEILMTVLGLLVGGVGILIAFAPRDPRR